MRLYALITPPPHVVADLAVAVEQATQVAPHVPWMPRHLWHLRLAYFGNLGLGEAAAVKETLTEIGRYCPPLSLRMAGVEAVPNDDQASTLQVGLAGDIDELWSLANAIPALVQKHGLFLDRRSFRASITIAHETIAPFDARDAAAALATYNGVPWVADDLRVVRWVPGSDGAADEWADVERYAFTAPREGADG